MLNVTINNGDTRQLSFSCRLNTLFRSKYIGAVKWGCTILPLRWRYNANGASIWVRVRGCFSSTFSLACFQSLSTCSTQFKLGTTLQTSLLLFPSNLAGTKFISCLAVVHLMKKKFSMLMKALLDFNTVTCDHNNSWSLHHACTSVHKRYKLYTLRTIYLITLFFFEILCPEYHNDLKKIAFFVFFVLRKKNTPELNILAKY